MAPTYAPTSASLVRPPRLRRFQGQPVNNVQAPTTAPGVNPAQVPPYGGNGVLPQPPAAAIPPAAPPGATAIDPNVNLRSVQINPVNAADTQAARAGMVGETQRVTGRSLPQQNFQTVGKRLNFNPVNTAAPFQGVDPNVGYQGVNTQATFRGVNPGVAGGAAVDPATSARLAAQQAMVDEQATKLAGVDRLKLAQEKFGTYANATNPEFENSIRSATEAAAAHGGLGSGMLTNQYGDLATTRARDLQAERDRLFQAAEEGSIQDQFNKVSALQGLSGQTAGEEAGVRGERRTERDTATGLSERNVGRTQAERDAELAAEERNIGRATGERDTALGLSERNLGRRQSERDAALAAQERGISRSQQERDAALGVDTSNLGLDISERNKGLEVEGANIDRTAADDYRRLGAATDLFSSLSGADRSARDEYRTERENQQREAQSAEDSAVRRTQLEEALKSGDFERALALAQYGDAGNAGAATLGVAGQQAGQNSEDLQGIMQLLQQYAYNRAAKPKAA